MEDIAGIDLELKKSDAVNDDVLSHSDEALIALSSSSTLTVDRSSGCLLYFLLLLMIK